MATRSDKLRAARLIYNRGEKKRALRAQTVERIIEDRELPRDPKFWHSAERLGI